MVISKLFARISPRGRNLIFCSFWFSIALLYLISFRGAGDKIVSKEVHEFIAYWRLPYDPANGDAVLLFLLYSSITLFFLLLEPVLDLLGSFLQFLWDLKTELVIRLS